MPSSVFGKTRLKLGGTFILIRSHRYKISMQRKEAIAGNGKT